MYKQTFRISKIRISEQVEGIIMRDLLYYFLYEMTILEDFDICISVPLRNMLARYISRSDIEKIYYL